MTCAVRPIGATKGNNATRGARRWQPGLTAHEGDSGRCLLVVVLALCLLGVVAESAGAQEGTPTMDRDGITPAECAVERRPEDDLRALFREVAASPVPASLESSSTPAGDPADEQTVAEISATWRQYLACMSAGDPARMFAVLSDDMVRRQFAVDKAFGVTEDALFEYLSATPVPFPPDQFVPFVPFVDVRVLTDGRVAATGPGHQGRGKCASSSERVTVGCSMTGSA